MTRADLSRLVEETPEPDLADLVGDLEAAKARAYARLTAPRVAAVSEHDRNLTAQEAAERLGMSTDWLYKHPELPFVVDMGGATRYSSAGIEKWLRTRRGRRA